MKHYKTQENEIRAIEEGQEFLIQDDWVELLDEELQVIINPPKTEEQIIAEQVAEAKAYLADTDWVVIKINEAQVLGEAIQDLLVKYKEILDKRQECRTIIN